FGTDLINNEVVIYIQIAKPSSPEYGGESDVPQFSVISASGRTVSEASRNISMFFSSISLWSQIQVTVLSEDMAKKGFKEQVDFLVRNRFASRTTTLVVTKDVTPEQVLNVNAYLENYSGMAIKKMLKNQEKLLGIYKHVSTENFLEALAAPGIEPTIPMITIRKNGNEKQLLLEDTAVFKDAKMIGTLNEMESRGFNLLDPKAKSRSIFLIASPINPSHKITLEISSSNLKVEPVIDGAKIKMSIKMEMDGNLYEQSGTENLFTPAIFKLIENSAEQELERQMVMAINKARALNSDILGWGHLIYRKDPQIWAKIGGDWDLLFTEIPYEITIDFNLRRSYLTDKTFVLR
ncbi:MAG TPA: Ger(x)C family spore germination protein, partial [Syntrophomonas sp.]|nr:Ger(x)C family spore germination protein [Syntrophomonas sp.]